MKIALITQARMTSERLPGKVMKTVLGKTLIAHQIERLRRVQTPCEIVLATTANPHDDALADEGARLGVRVFRGSEDDVLSRFAGAAAQVRADAVIRVTGDCPVLDPAVIDRIAGVFLGAAGKLDYVSNTIRRRTFPRGMDCEVFAFAALDTANREAVSRRDREHVTPFIYTDPDRFRLSAVFSDADHSAHRWTVDTAEDFALIEKILQALYPQNPSFGIEDVLRLLDKHPEWVEINRGVVQKQSSEEFGKSPGKAQA